MKLSQNTRNRATALLAVATISLAAACGDSIGAPTREVSFKAPAGFDRVIGVKIFRVEAGSATIQLLGNHAISIPAGAICNPLQSSYGPAYWDAPCTPLHGSIVITATMLEDNDGRPYVDFQPALRFVPTKEVKLFLKSPDPEAIQHTVAYCDNLGFCVDESLTDPTLVPRRIANSSLIVRRIKHFSGYMIVSGEQCSGTVTQDPDGTLWCNPDANGANFSRRSGYMVASGLSKKTTRDSNTPPDAKKHDH